MIRMLKYACAVIAAGVIIGCSSDKNITIGHPETVEPDKTFDVVLANFYVYGSPIDLDLPIATNPGATRDSLRIVTGLPSSDWQVLEAACYAVKDFNIATLLRGGTQSIDTQALYDTLKTYISKLEPMEPDPASEAAILGKKDITAHNSANKETKKINPSNIKKWVAFKGDLNIKLEANAKHDTVLPIDTLANIAKLMGTDITSSLNTINTLGLDFDTVGFTIKPVIAVLKIKAPSTASSSDTLFYYSRSTALSAGAGIVSQDMGDMTYIPVSVAATPVKRQVAAVKPANYTVQSSNGTISIVFANKSSSQYAELFRANGSLVKKVIASHGTAQFNKTILESSGSGFVKITNGSSVSVQKLSVVK